MIKKDIKKILSEILKLKKINATIFFIMLCSTVISILHQAIPKIVENIGYLTFGTLSTCLTIFNYILIKNI